MSVTDNQPTKVGQRVQEIFSDTRGWVVELGRHEGVDSAVVNWDQPTKLGDDDQVFPIDALRVVEVIRVDVDIFADPGRSPLVEEVSHPEGTFDYSKSRYRFTDGEVAVGLEAARYYLLKRSASGWDD